MNERATQHNLSNTRHIALLEKAEQALQEVANGGRYGHACRFNPDRFYPR